MNIKSIKVIGYTLGLLLLLTAAILFRYGIIYEYLWLQALGIILVAFVAVVLFLRPMKAPELFLPLTAVIMSAYIGEIVLCFRSLEKPTVIGLVPPNETISSKELDQQRNNAYRHFFPSLFTETNGIGDSLYPLAGLSNVKTLFCNEIGKVQFYNSDRYGFRNRDEVHNELNADIALIGDSFTNGACVDEIDTIAGRLSAAYPNSKLINFGMSGDGSLSELATLIEYAKNYKPKKVIWFFYEGNDYLDTIQEMKSSILRNYLEGSFTQNLKGRQKLIDQAYTAYFDKKIKITESAKPIEVAAHATTKIKTENKAGLEQESILKKASLAVVRFVQFRTLVDTIRFYFGEVPDKALFEKIFTKAKSEVDAWNGELYIVFLPSPTHLYRDGSTKRDFFKLMKKIGIKTIDFDQVLRSDNDIWSNFTYLGGHYSVKGYKQLADTVVENLEKQP